MIWDIVAVTAASAIGFILRWTIPYNLDISDGTYVFFAAVVVLSWISVLVLRGAYDTRILGVGSEEFKRIVGASALVFAAIAIVSFALKLDLSRGFVLITFAVGMLLLLTVRWVLRAWLRHERMYGHFLHRTIVIGSGQRANRDRRHARPRSGRRIHRGRCHRRTTGRCHRHRTRPVAR